MPSTGAIVGRNAVRSNPTGSVYLGAGKCEGTHTKRLNPSILTLQARILTHGSGSRGAGPTSWDPKEPGLTSRWQFKPSLLLIWVTTGSGVALVSSPTTDPEFELRGDCHPIA